MDTPANADALEPVAFERLEHFAGFDWASEKHDVAVVDHAGTLVLQLRFADTAEGWAQLREKLAGLGRVGVAIETSRGPAVERLLEMNLTVFPMNPKAAERFRDRKAPSGVKDDALDAWSFADALRSDGRAWRPLLPEDPQTQLLRLLCRDEISLIEQRTALVNRLRQCLREYYPAALEAFDDWVTAGAWELIVRFPTPAELAGAGKRKWEKFLHGQRLWRPETATRRLEVFARADRFASPSAAVTAAKSLLAVTLAKQLRTLQGQIDEYRRRIEELFDQHPDAGIFKSLPGAASKLAPRLLGEIGANRAAFASAAAVQCYAGTAPLTRKSGASRLVRVRRMCNHVLRATVHLWADESRRVCAWAQAYYQYKRQCGHGHAAALRCLGQRWLKILWKMWTEHKAYDEARHMLSMVKHGSWVLAHLPQPRPAAAAITP
jgi:transposase